MSISRFKDFLQDLDIPDSELCSLLSLTPDKYTGMAERLTGKAISMCKKILEDSSLLKTKIIGFSDYINRYNNNLKELGIIKIIEKPFTFRDLEEKLIPELFMD